MMKYDCDGKYKYCFKEVDIFCSVKINSVGCMRKYCMNCFEITKKSMAHFKKSEIKIISKEEYNTSMGT